MLSLPINVRTLAGAVALGTVLVATGACGGSDGEDAADDPTTSATPSSPAPTESEPTEVATDDPESPDVPGGVVMVGDKSVMLDGFIGVRIPEGWSITSADVPLLSATPAGEPETELDASALAQSLVLNPDASPRGATFSLVHYEHSDSVPDLGRFSSAVVDLLSGDGSQIADPSEATIGGQTALLHQVKSASGANGVMVALKSGEEYFFILSLVSETAYAEEVGEMLTSVSFVPEALHG